MDKESYKAQCLRAEEMTEVDVRNWFRHLLSVEGRKVMGKLLRVCLSYDSLSKQNLSTEEGVRSALMAQGIITGISMAIDTLLEETHNG